MNSKAAVAITIPNFFIAGSSFFFHVESDVSLVDVRFSGY
jgi:hypothetical protein